MLNALGQSIDAGKFWGEPSRTQPRWVESRDVEASRLWRIWAVYASINRSPAREAESRLA